MPFVKTPEAEDLTNLLAACSMEKGVTEYLAVPEDKVGRVIGRGGVTIRGIQERSGAHVPSWRKRVDSR